jgi:hypothetical protein
MTKKKPINVENIDLDLMKERTTDIPGLLEYAHNLGGFSIAPTKEGQIKSTALKAMQGQTQMQMDQIYEQMKLLADQAKKLQDRVTISQHIYNAKISFKPVIGNSYYLYKKDNQEKVLSLIKPSEWKNCPYKYLAKVTLLADHTWEVEEKA